MALDIDLERRGFERKFPLPKGDVFWSSNKNCYDKPVYATCPDDVLLDYQCKWQVWLERARESDDHAQDLVIAHMGGYSKAKSECKNRIERLQEELGKASGAAANNFDAMNTVEDWLIENDLLLVKHQGAGVEAGLDIVESIKAILERAEAAEASLAAMRAQGSDCPV